jgi:hypothetical protein
MLRGIVRASERVHTIVEAIPSVCLLYNKKVKGGQLLERSE